MVPEPAVVPSVNVRGHAGAGTTSPASAGPWIWAPDAAPERPMYEPVMSMSTPSSVTVTDPLPLLVTAGTSLAPDSVALYVGGPQAMTTATTAPKMTMDRAFMGIALLEG